MCKVLSVTHVLSWGESTARAELCGWTKETFVHCGIQAVRCRIAELSLKVTFVHCGFDLCPSYNNWCLDGV